MNVKASCRSTNHVSVKQGLIGTTLHTLVMYGAPLIGLHQVKIARYLGRILKPKGSAMEQSANGLAMHYLLGALIFPVTYNLVAKRFLPDCKVSSGMCWGMILWFTGQNLVFPLIGKKKLFERHPDAAWTYWLGHLLYGIACSRPSSRH